MMVPARDRALSGPHESRRKGTVPTVLFVGPYRFYFYAWDRHEPPHVHVERDNCRAKIWLEPVRLRDGGRFRRREIVRVIALVWEQRQELVEAWDEFFAN